MLKPTRKTTWRERPSTVWMMTMRRRCKKTTPSKVSQSNELRLLLITTFWRSNEIAFVHRFSLRKWHRSLLQSRSRADEIQARWEVLCCPRLHQAELGMMLLCVAWTPNLLRPCHASLCSPSPRRYAAITSWGLKSWRCFPPRKTRWEQKGGETRHVAGDFALILTRFCLSSMPELRCRLSSGR